VTGVDGHTSVTCMDYCITANGGHRALKAKIFTLLTDYEALL